MPLSWSAANRAVDYEIQYRVVGAPSWETPTVTTVLTSTTVTGLANGSTYEFQVRATNTGGVSAWSASVTATPAAAGAPGVPTGVTATSGEWAQTVVTWSSVSGATSYTVQYRVQGAGGWTTRSAIAGTTDTITGLPDGTPYEVQVKASNASGDSAWAPGSPATATTGSWAQISTGANHTCGVTTTGRAYCWGSDTLGQLGNGAVTGNQTTPNAVDTTTGLTTTNVAQISTGGSHT